MYINEHMTKQLIVIITLLVFTSIFWNCKRGKVVSKTDFEQAVFYEIFPEIIDSIYFEKRLSPPPPPPPEFFDKAEYENNIEKAIQDYFKTDEFIEDKNNWKKKKDSLEQDTASTYLIVFDSVSSTDKEDESELIKYFEKTNIVLDSKELDSNYLFKIDLNKLNTNNKKFKFKYQSQFPKGREFWRTKYDFYVGAKIGFSRILFDDSKSYGVLNAGFGTGILNGNGFRIFIRKNDKDEWIIVKVNGTWSS